MSLPVFYGEIAGSVARLTGDEAHHAAVVRRIAVGERVLVADGRGEGAVGLVNAASRQLVEVAVDELRSEAAPQPRLVVVQALAKGDRGELAVELLTEVGADVIVPWGAERCVVRARGERADKLVSRWTSTVRAAAKQARRLRIPEVRDIASAAEVTDLLASAALAVVLHESASSSLAQLQVPDSGDLVVVVGPEGGITDAELAGLGVDPVRLGQTVMRTSTAGAAACSALLSRTARWT